MAGSSGVGAASGGGGSSGAGGLSGAGGTGGMSGVGGSTGGAGSTCPTLCQNAHGSADCSSGTCTTSCTIGYADCDADATNGCEASTSDVVATCGSCTLSCANPNGTAACSGGLCAPTCNPNFGDCDTNTSNGCESNLHSVSSCGACGVSCANAHGTTSCPAGLCLPSCATNYGNCDGDATNGCESNLASDPAHCGSCTNACGSNGQICVNGMCQASPCTPGLAECDGNLAVTCETNINTSLGNCGFCGNACSAANGTPQCAAASCGVASCNGGYANCDAVASNGCEVQLATNAAHCGSCATACTNAHGTTSCAAASCVPSCGTGFGDCDASRPNGCETALNTLTNCGSCGNACSTANGTPQCAAGSCGVASCNGGFGNCDGVVSNGCEATLNTLTNCGSCGNACSTANGTPQCAAGSCGVASCNGGYANCDSVVSNGCEVQLSTNTANCGACGSACTNAHGTTSCAASSCVPSCGAGYGDCDASRPNGCETALNTVTNCGSCGNVCPANGGTPVCNAGVCGTICDLTGTFALKLQVRGTWPNDTYTAAGSGTFLFWQKAQLTQSGNSVTGTLLECGRYVPPFDARSVSETFLFQHPTSLFDHVPAYLPTTPVTFTLGSSSPGATVTLPISAVQMGVNMANPTTGSWPATSGGLTQIDMDADGKPGVTVLYIGTGGYDFPRTGGTLFAARSDSPYIASRVSFSLSGTLTSCTQSTGAATVTHLDTRIFGCSLSGSASDCSGSEASFLDTNCLNYTMSGSPQTYTLVKVAAGASCAAVRAALP
jgi:hypothetical protein